MTPNRFEELDSLLLDWDEGTLNEAGIERLREILRTDDESRAHYVRLQMMAAAMSLDGEAGMDDFSADDGVAQGIEDVFPKGRVLAGTSSSRHGRWMLAAAVLLVGLLAGRLAQLEMAGHPDESNVIDEPGNSIVVTDERDESEEATSRGVALITQLVDVTWPAEQRSMEVGDALPPGAFEIASGYAQIEFFCGATVILGGPAELDLKSPLLATVRRGTLRAQVPPAARGFSLEVDDLKVVDLGTEFGLSVTDEGANVQVFDGEVELLQPKTEKRLLTPGKALVRTPNGVYEETTVTPDSFLDIATLESRARGQHNARYQRWRSWSEELRRDPRLITYYAFDQSDGWNRRLTNSLEPANSELDGAIVGADRSPGRWPAKSSLEFKRPGDRVRVQLPGEYGSLSFSCWVKIDSLDRWFNSLFLTDGYNKGEPHWQILDTGQLYFSVRPRERGEAGPVDFKALSPPFWKPSLSGRWLHLATVYDVPRASITHYLNGEVLSEASVPTEKMVEETRIGTASIGNWSVPTKPDSRFAIRNLNGSMDEFALFAAALTDDEIKKIYDNGRP